MQTPHRKGRTVSDQWKTGQRVPAPGLWKDQHGYVSQHAPGATFPPCIGRKGECAWRTYLGTSWTDT